MLCYATELSLNALSNDSMLLAVDFDHGAGRWSVETMYVENSLVAARAQDLQELPVRRLLPEGHLRAVNYRSGKEETGLLRRDRAHDGDNLEVVCARSGQVRYCIGQVASVPQVPLTSDSAAAPDLVANGQHILVAERTVESEFNSLTVSNGIMLQQYLQQSSGPCSGHP